MTVVITYERNPPTPAPTLQPGVPCHCEPGTCGIFTFIDLDNDGCLSEEEVNKIEGLEGHFAEIDTNGDGCLDQTECSSSPYADELPLFPVIGPPECDYGYYFTPGTSVCKPCFTGETRRRRSEACTECPPGKEDVGAFDNCISGVWLVEDLEAGSNLAWVNKDIDESGVKLQRGDGITISTRNPGHYERAIITGTIGFDRIERLSYANETFWLDNDVILDPNHSGKAFWLDHGVHAAFKKYDPVVSACTNVNGIDLSGQYPCGCGIEICELGYRCYEGCGASNTVLDPYHDLSYGTGGCCLGPPTFPLATPMPTVSARGDPHLVNLQGEHFDVNHGGDFTLLRIPQSVNKPAEVALDASIRPEHERPCTTYITEVTLSGSWLNGAVVQVRSYLKSRAGNRTDQSFGVRVLESGAPSEAPWEGIEELAQGDRVISKAGLLDGFTVSMSKTQWNSRKGAGGAPTAAGQIVFRLQSGFNTESALIVVRQDLPGQEHLNLAVRHLFALGRADVGGLLGFDAHSESLEAVTPECQRHRDGLDGQKGPRFTKPAWKSRWEKIRQRRHEPRRPGTPGQTMNDNEAAASLRSKDLMCVCPDGAFSMGAAEDEHSEIASAGETEGVVADFQTGRLAEATWD
jgi:hypothetical protein